MARSGKRGISYFPLDVDVMNDRKIRRVRKAHGACAVTVVLAALCRIFGENGYYMAFGDDFCFDLADELELTQEYVRGVLLCCVEAGFFDADLFRAHGVLTSRRIQNNYVEATRRRANAAIALELDLIGAPEEGPAVDGNPAAFDGNPAAVDGNPAAVDGESTQSKVNKNKGEESKAHTAGGGGSSLPLVKLSPGERASLAAEFGEAAAARMVEMLAHYKGASGKQYASDYHAIRSWVVKRWREENAAKPAYYERPTENYDHLAVNFFADAGG
jgi:hypothetical protein